MNISYQIHKVRGVSRREFLKRTSVASVLSAIPFLGSCGGAGGGSSTPAGQNETSVSSSTTAVSTTTTTTVPPSQTVVAFKVHGLNFGPFIDGQDPAQNLPISDAQIRTRLQIIAAYTQWGRTFGTTNGLQNVPAIAQSLGMKTMAGAFLGTDLVANEVQIANLIAIGVARQAPILVVGNETLLTNALTEEQLIAYIRRVKAAVPADIIVTTADTYDRLLAHPAILAEVDVVAANIYPYFEGIEEKNAVAFLDSKYSLLKAAAPGKEIIITETGWPSGGVNNGAAVVSPENAAAYFINFVSWARAKSVNYFYFEALDETWKAAVEGPQGSHWGVFDKNGVLKPGMQDVFDGKTVPDNWTGINPIGGPGTPQIQFDFVPTLGTFDNLRGSVLHVKPADFGVAVYIQVGGWWIKPFFDSPITTIFPDGSWTCDITTGGFDSTATSIAAFLIPNGYSPPRLLNAPALPAELDTNAVAKVTVNRP